MTSDDVGTVETLISLRGILQMKKGFSSQLFVFHFFTILIFCKIFLSTLIYMQYVILYLWRLIVSCAFVVFTLVVWNNMHVSWFMVLRQSAHLCLGFEVHVHVAHTIICFSYDVGLYSGVWVIISIIWGTCMLFISEYTSLQHKYLCFWYLAGNLNKNSILFVEFFMCAINADVVYTISVMLVSYLLRSLFMSTFSF